MRPTCCACARATVWLYFCECVLCCKVNATGDLLSSNPGALGHCKSFTLPWCSRDTVYRSFDMWAAATVCHFKYVFVWHAKGGSHEGDSHILTGCVQVGWGWKAEEGSWRKGGKKKLVCGYINKVFPGDICAFALTTCLPLSFGEYYCIFPPTHTWF